MLTRLHISSFIGLTIIVWLVTLWVQGNPVLSSEFIKPFGIVVSAITSIALIFNKYAWSWNVFKNWYVKRPDLRGTWKMELQSSWVDPNTGKQIDPIIGYVVIRQTLTFLSFRMFTKESRSKSITHTIEREDDGLYKLAVVYRNEPDINLQGVRSEIHYGSFILNINGDPANELQGHYWTDRTTKGSLKLTDRIKNKTINTYLEGVSEYSAD